MDPCTEAGPEHGYYRNSTGHPMDALRITVQGLLTKSHSVGLILLCLLSHFHNSLEGTG